MKIEDFEYGMLVFDRMIPEYCALVVKVRKTSVDVLWTEKPPRRPLIEKYNREHLQFLESAEYTLPVQSKKKEKNAKTRKSRV